MTEVLSGRAAVRELEERVAGGEIRALRALVRQCSGPNTLTMTTTALDVREKANGTGGSSLTFTGYASTYVQPDGSGYYAMEDWVGDYAEGVHAGAATKSLNDGADVIFCLNHDWDAVPLARSNAAATLRFPGYDSDTIGLPVEADLDASRSDVALIRSAMERGELDAMSFAFRVVRQSWSPDYDQRDILEVQMFDVSLVTHPANPGTAGSTGLRKAAADAILRSNVIPLLGERVREETRAGATLSGTTAATLKHVLSLISASDRAVDEAQPLLADLLGVPNPDIAQDAELADSESKSGDEDHQTATPGRSLALARAIALA